MQFLDIQNEVITARFKETQRDSVKQWINLAYAKVWHSDEWTFRRATAPLTITPGDQTPTLPTDFHRAFDVFDDESVRLEYLTPDDFANMFWNDTTTGTPGYWTVVNKVLYVGPTPAVSSTSFDLLYEAAFTTLVDDGDVPLLPPEFHYILVHGAMVIGLVNENDFTYALPSQLFDEGVFAMRQGYVSDNGMLQFKRDRLGGV